MLIYLFVQWTVVWRSMSRTLKRRYQSQRQLVSLPWCVCVCDWVSRFQTSCKLWWIVSSTGLLGAKRQAWRGRNVSYDRYGHITSHKKRDQKRNTHRRTGFSCGTSGGVRLGRCSITTAHGTLPQPHGLTDTASIVFWCGAREWLFSLSCEAECWRHCMMDKWRHHVGQMRAGSEVVEYQDSDYWSPSLDEVVEYQDSDYWSPSLDEAVENQVSDYSLTGLDMHAPSETARPPPKPCEAAVPPRPSKSAALQTRRHFVLKKVWLLIWILYTYGFKIPIGGHFQNWS